VEGEGKGNARIRLFLPFLFFPGGLFPLLSAFSILRAQGEREKTAKIPSLFGLPFPFLLPSADLFFLFVAGNAAGDGREI